MENSLERQIHENGNGVKKTGKKAFPEDCINSGGTIFIKTAYRSGTTPYGWCRLKDECPLAVQERCRSFWP